MAGSGTGGAPRVTRLWTVERGILPRAFSAEIKMSTCRVVELYILPARPRAPHPYSVFLDPIQSAVHSAAARDPESIIDDCLLFPLRRPSRYLECPFQLGDSALHLGT